MSKASRPIRYRNNGNIWGLPDQGKKVMDAVTGYWTYRDELTINEFGDLVDGKGDGLDRNEVYPYNNKGL